MSKKIFLLLVFLCGLASPGQSQTLDRYGGRTDVKCAHATGWFHAEKLGNRWWLCTPLGNAFFMQGVEQVVPSIDATYSSTIQAKYGGTTAWAVATNQRLLSWGFNTLATGAYLGILPTVIDSKFARGPLGLRSPAMKMPFMVSVRPAFYAMSNPVMGNRRRLLSEPVKNALYGHSAYYHGWVSSGGVPDYFDTNIGVWLTADLQVSSLVNALQSSPYANYLIGITSDDGDEMNGMSAGPDFVSVPPGQNNYNLAMMVAAMSPVQTANSNKGWVYTNTTVHTKAALHDSLVQKYGTVAALNSAWGSNYSTFDSSGKPISGEIIGTGNGSNLTFTHILAKLQPSRFSVQILVNGVPVAGDTGTGTVFGPAVASGAVNYTTGALSITFASGSAPAASASITVNYIQNGWEIGTGFLDEDDRPSHQSWMGNDWVYMNNANPNVKADMNTFLEQMAAQYFKTCHDGLKAVFPNILYLGPDSLGTYSTPPPAPVLRAAGQYLDAALLNGMQPFTQAELDYIEKNFGKPFFGGFYSYANPDSALNAYPNGNAVNGFSTQAMRGQAYVNYITGLLADKASDGVSPYIGVTFWELTDGWGEKTNWGIITHLDNAYDGHEAVTSSVSCSPPLQALPCGGEQANYGDVISWLKKANHLWLLLQDSGSAASGRVVVH